MTSKTTKWVCTALLLFLLTASMTQAGGYHWVEKQKLVPTDAQVDNYFGYSVSTSRDADCVMAGAYGDDREGDYDDYGSAYAYTPRDDWTSQDKLYAGGNPPTDQAQDDEFGRSVAISGDGTFVAVGTPYKDETSTDSGTVYVYQWNGSSWDYKRKLSPPEPSNYDNFGYSVAMSRYGNYIIVGAPYDDDDGSSSGAAFVFRSFDDWGSVYDTKTLDGGETVESYDYFGWSVAMDNYSYTPRYVLVGAKNDDEYSPASTNSGAAYVFERSGSNWYKAGRLTASDCDDYDYFGYSVGISYKYAVIGAYGDDDGGSYSGSAYIFKDDDTNWVQYDKLVADDAYRYDYFGRSSAIYYSSRAIIGAYGEDAGGSSAGAAYIFTRSGENWSQFEKLTASDADSSDNFGYAVAIGRNYAIVGAPYNDDTASNSGSAYIYHYEWDPTYSTQSSVELATQFENKKFLVGDEVDILWNRGEDVSGLYVEYYNGVSWQDPGGALDPDIGDPNGLDPEGVGNVSYRWTVPTPTTMPADECFIRVTDGDSNSVMSGPFAIKQLILLTPDSKEEGVHPDDTARISWRSDGIVVNVNLQYSTDNGEIWIPIATVPAVNGYYDWPIPDPNSTEYQIMISDSTNSDVYDIVPEMPSIVSQNFGITNEDEAASYLEFTIGVQNENNRWFAQDETTGQLKYEINLLPNQGYPIKSTRHTNSNTGEVDSITFEYSVAVEPYGSLNIHIDAELNAADSLELSKVRWNSFSVAPGSDVPSTADLNDDGLVDLDDVAILSAHWLDDYNDPDDPAE